MMKITLIGLICLASLSYQQRFSPYQPLHYSPRLFYWPWGYENEYYQPENVIYNGADDGSDVQARMLYRGQDAGPSPAARFFFQNGGFFGGGRPGGSNFGTTTVFATSMSTAIVANLLACIPATQFTSASSTQATNPCARRKRLVAEIIDALEEADDVPEPIRPSFVTKVETTEVPESRNIEPVIESSHNEELNDQDVAIKREERAFNMVTVSSWITSYSFITTNIKKTYTLANSAALACLPPGFVVC